MLTYLLHFLRWWHRWSRCIVIMSEDGQWTPHEMCGRCKLFVQSRPFNAMLVWQDGRPKHVSTINGERP